MAWAGKIAIVSHVLPPSSSGQAVMLYRLLRDWDPDRYCLISTRDYADPHAVPPDAVTPRLPCRYHHLPSENQFRILESPPFRMARMMVRAARQVRRGLAPTPTATTAPLSTAQTSVLAPPQPSLLARLAGTCQSVLHGWDQRINLPRRVTQRARAIEEIARREGCTAIVASTADLIDLPASFLAARAVGIAYYSYMFDDYSSQWVNPEERRFAQAACRQVIQEADGVIVPNEFLARVYRQTYGIEAVIVRNSVAEIPPLPPPRVAGQPFRIVFTGTIYEAHFDAFIRLTQMLTRFAAGEIEFHIYTASDPAYLAKHGIGAPAILHASVSSMEALSIQRSADALFLPLAFASPYPEIINTSAPGKMGEYLASGRPVLVHAPRESFLSWYCRQHACAAVVDGPSVDWLHAATLELIQSPTLGDTLVRNARRRAIEDFHVDNVQRNFQRIFEGIIPRVQSISPLGLSA